MKDDELYYLSCTILLQSYPMNSYCFHSKRSVEVKLSMAVYEEQVMKEACVPATSWERCLLLFALLLYPATNSSLITALAHIPFLYMQHVCALTFAT